MDRTRARQGEHDLESDQIRYDKRLFNKMDADDGNQDGNVRFHEFHQELIHERNKPIDLRMMAAGHLSAAKGSQHLSVPPIKAASTTHHKNK